MTGQTGGMQAVPSLVISICRNTFICDMFPSRRVNLKIQSISNCTISGCSGSRLFKCRIKTDLISRSRFLRLFLKRKTYLITHLHTTDLHAWGALWRERKRCSITNLNTVFSFDRLLMISMVLVCL